MMNFSTPAIASALSFGFAVSLALPAQAQVPAFDVLTVVDESTAGPGDLTNLGQIYGGAHTGWVALGIQLDPGGTPVPVLYGQLSDDDPLGPRVLRAPGLFSGLQQRGISGPSLAAGKIAYLASTDLTPLQRGVWLDDDLITQVGMPAGNSGLVWERIRSVQLATDGTLAVLGTGLGAGSDGLLIEYPSGDVLAMAGDDVPAASEPVSRILGFDRSPDGQRLVINAMVAPSERTLILVDGDAYTFDNGSRALLGELVIPGPSSFQSRWRDFGAGRVTNDGRIAFSARYDEGAISIDIAVRDGGETSGPVGTGSIPFLRPVAISEDGFLLWGNMGMALSLLHVEDQPLFPDGYGIDVDGDGSVDPGLFLTGINTAPHAAMNGDGSVYVITNVEDRSAAPFVDTFQVAMRSRLVQGGSTICDGVANSEGLPARLIAVGSDDVSFNEMNLVALGLPPFRFALPLFSRVPGAGFTPTGSVGTVCLGGAIGRGNFVTMRANSFGTDSGGIFLNALPQPSGSVAALPGDTWYCQLWYRDTVQGSPTSNFSSATSIQFR